MRAPPGTGAPSWLTARPIAHRGLHDRAAGIPENTLAAARAAVARGFAIECDEPDEQDDVHGPPADQDARPSPVEGGQEAAVPRLGRSA